MANGAIEADEVRIAPNGAVYVAPIGSAAPTDLSTPLTSAWTNLGYITEDGVSITPNVDTNDIMAWQSAAPIKRGINSTGLEVSFSMMQTNKETTALFFGGGVWTNGPSGVATLTIPSNPLIADLESAMVIEWQDDAGDNQRLYFSRGMVTDREAVTLTRPDAVVYGVTYVAFDDNGVLGRLLSDSLELYSS